MVHCHQLLKVRDLSGTLSEYGDVNAKTPQVALTMLCSMLMLKRTTFNKFVEPWVKIKINKGSN